MVVIGAMGSVDVAAMLEPVGFVFIPFSGGPILMTWTLIGILACFCPCIVYSKVKHRYQHLNSKGYPDPENGGCCNSDCMIHGVITCVLDLASSSRWVNIYYYPDE
jgi:hypothetical protein